MAIDLTALKSELLNDPATLGYAAPRTAGNTQALADLLNQIRGSIQINRGVIPAYEIINAIVPADWSALSAAEKQRIELITGAGQVDVKNANVRNQFLQAFGAGTTTRTNLGGLQNRDGSHAEQLFGADVTVSNADVAAALALP